MQGQGFTMLLISIILLLLDAYIIKGIRAAFKKKRFLHNRNFVRYYWIVCAALVAGTLISIYLKIPVGLRAGILLSFFIVLLLKISFLLFILVDDIRRIIVWFSLIKKEKAPQSAEPTKILIPRSEFLMK